MSKHLDSVIHKQAGVSLTTAPSWERHEIGCLELCVPHYFAVHPFRCGVRATGAKSVGLEAVLKHNRRTG